VLLPQINICSSERRKTSPGLPVSAGHNDRDEEVRKHQKIVHTDRLGREPGEVVVRSVDQTSVDWKLALVAMKNIQMPFQMRYKCGRHTRLEVGQSKVVGYWVSEWTDGKIRRCALQDALYTSYTTEVRLHSLLKVCDVHSRSPYLVQTSNHPLNMSKINVHHHIYPSAFRKGLAVVSQYSASNSNSIML
jgi:hypothetical protein